MPGIGGIDLAKILRRTTPELPVVLASGHRDILAQEGTHGFELLQKPHSADRVSRTGWAGGRGPRNAYRMS